MSNGRDIVITAYGHDKIIDKIAASVFDRAGNRDDGDNSNAKTYCGALNSLSLNENSWVFAKIVSENTQYSLDSFLPLRFDIIIKLDDRAVQKVLREADSLDIAKALKGEKEAVQEKVFGNMSKNAVRLVKADMEFMGQVQISDVKESQEKIINVIRCLEDSGEIVIPHFEGGTVS
ncbi:MAG: hypothetical protein Pg6C_05450 [Treponemataceae bacterium]|nr:MAG: hypothetical protein Pg6C_05450 [Treponemataceae bacterium]